MFDSLRAVTDDRLLADTTRLAAQDRQLTLQLLAHLHEIERRKLYLKRGYSSMFDYCRTHLLLSEGSAMRRIRTARCLARYPELHPLLESGAVNPMSVALISRVLRPGNARVLIERIQGKSKREVEAIVAEYEPRSLIPRDSVRPIAVVAATTTATGGGGNPGGDTLEHECQAGALQNPPVLETHHIVQFTARSAFMAKVERARSLVSHQLPGATFEQLFEFALDELIARRDPVERQSRRERRAVVRTGPVPTGKRHVPAAVRDQIFVRDGFRCAFVGSDGRRCTSTVALQVDHVRPVARGGAGTKDNLRILCAQHNRLEAERIMGSRGALTAGYSP